MDSVNFMHPPKCKTFRNLAGSWVCRPVGENQNMPEKMHLKQKLGLHNSNRVLTICLESNSLGFTKHLPQSISSWHCQVPTPNWDSWKPPLVDSWGTSTWPPNARAPSAHTMRLERLRHGALNRTVGVMAKGEELWMNAKCGDMWRVRLKLMLMNVVDDSFRAKQWGSKQWCSGRGGLPATNDTGDTEDFLLEVFHGFLQFLLYSSSCLHHSGSFFCFTAPFVKALRR